MTLLSIIHVAMYIVIYLIFWYSRILDTNDHGPCLAIQPSDVCCFGRKAYSTYIALLYTFLAVQYFLRIGMMLGFSWILYLILFFFYIYIPQSEQAWVKFAFREDNRNSTGRAMVTTAIYSINSLVWPILHIWSSLCLGIITKFCF